MSGGMQQYLLSLVKPIYRFINKSLVKNLLIVILCMMFVLVQVFYPYQFYASESRAKNSDFVVGIHYVFEQDQVGQIRDQVRRIHDLGFKTIRITLECNPDYRSDTMNQKNDEFFSAADYYGIPVALVIPNDDTTSKVDYYLTRWGSHLTYIQILNEPELSSSWSPGALFTDDEITSKFNTMYETVNSHHLSATYYTNFGLGYIIRSNVPVELSKKLDFVGLDIYMDSFLTLSPLFVKNLHEVTNKDVTITEFGMSTSSSQAQTDFIIKGLNLYKSMGLDGCWLCYWNSQFDNYGIRDRPTEQAVGVWIANNAS
jgi:hypothetical protein